MIDECFTFLDGIGPRLEMKFRAQGIRTWDDFLAVHSVRGISAGRKKHYDRLLVQANGALQKGDSSFFVSHFPQLEIWRLYARFKDKCYFLDCEVDSHGQIIVATIFDRFECKTLVRNVNLETKQLEKALDGCEVLVTYNGSAFDVPKLRKQFGVELNIPHIDLKPLCQRLGLVGGLKDVEKQLGIERPVHLRGHAVDAWKALWASGDKEWLDVLVQYNEEDTVNLYRVVEKCMGIIRGKI
jgi:uncharacterized protein YprB with RNaseH-like and TPR domain